MKKWIVMLARILPGCLAAMITCSTPAADSRALIEHGQRSFDKGSFSEASADWENALTSLRRAGDTKAEIQTSLSLANAYHALGRQQRAIDVLEDASKKAERLGDKSLITAVNAKLGAALVMKRDNERAEFLLHDATASAEESRDSKLLGQALNDLGNLLAARQVYVEALAAYEKSVKLAREASNSGLLAEALCNSAAAAAHAGDFAKADELNSQAFQAIDALESNHSKAFLLLTAAQTDRAIRVSDAEATKRLQLRAHRSLQQALDIAEKTNDQFIETYSLGYLGQMYEADKQSDAALSLTRRAVFAAQQSQLTEPLYRWEAQIARLLKAEGKSEAAISAYRTAIQTLQSIRNDVSAGYGNTFSYRSFRESEGPLFLGYADLLLEKSKTANPTDEQKLLLEAREVVEQLKYVELESYFCDDCVDVQRSKTRAVETIDKETAVIYIISLPSRTEILVGLTSGLKRFTANVGDEALTSEVRQFRRNLETRTSFAYLEQGQQLYDWLIRPILPLLKESGVTTLVIVPDGAIRTIPFAALYDGEHFLIEDLAVAVVPGLSMVDPKPIELAKSRMLLNGLTESVQGFAPLDFVGDELQGIQKSRRSETLMNAAFTRSSLEHKLGQEQFSVVHIASHGKFDRDVRKTFVLTHDAKLTLNDLEAAIRPSQYRGKPVELLVLSACQTAAGDDRAALGLAGVAIKAGARSALASLWFVNDQSTSELISELYQQLQQTPRVSKAQAIRNAQIKLLNDRRFRHPCYWSPYLIIGNWL